MTPRQQELLVVIARYRAEHGIAPSYRELLPLMGMSENSIGGLSHLVTLLERDGYVRRIPGRKRNIEVLRLPEAVARTALTAREVAWCHDHADQVRGLM